MLKQLIEEYGDLKEEFEIKIQGEFLKQLRFFREQMPKGLGLSWQQYTPHFNDGDPCTFGVIADFEQDADIEFEGIEDFTLYDRENDWEIKEGCVEGTHTTHKDIDKMATDLSKLIYMTPSEVLEQAFGDHKRVTLTKEGVEVDEYAHS